MRYSNKMPSVNAGSMADIAFLLLIFFLVTSMIPNDKGIVRELPRPCPPGADCNIPLVKRNIFTINVNNKGELLANESPMAVGELKDALKNFIDNNGDKSCEYCKGDQIANASDNPKRASISLAIQREAPYETFISVQNEILKAYSELRTNYVSSVLNKKTDSITDQILKKAQEAYPFRIIESSI